MQDPSAQLHRCLLYLPEQRADLGVAVVHGPLQGCCYRALLEAFSLTLNPVIDLPLAARANVAEGEQSPAALAHPLLPYSMWVFLIAPPK